MVVDHFSKIILLWMLGHLSFSESMTAKIQEAMLSWLYPIGTIAFPLFAFLLSEGFQHSQHRKRYFALMAGFALLSELPFDLAFFSWQTASTFDTGGLFYWGYQNVFFTLLLGLCALWLMERAACLPWPRWGRGLLLIPCAAVPALVATLIHSDYGAYGVLLCAGFYGFRAHRWQQMAAGLILYILCTGNQPPLCTLLAFALLLLYNGTRGKHTWKYFFYIFYPAHLTVCYLTIQALGA